MYALVTAHDGASDITDAAEQYANPSNVQIFWQENNDTGLYFDIHPGSPYASGSAVEDVGQTGTNDVTVVSPEFNASPTADNDLCSERWYLSLTAVACVEMVGSVKRSRNTGDTSHDIVLDYSNTYNVHAMVGRVADTADEALKLGYQDVDFTEFFDEDEAGSAFNLMTASWATLSALVYICAF